ncbi:MAG: phosphoenolpyruvate--protein phosphotransferase [Lysobacterales bacterium CG17_big_fil_post_rev_8_21_14_2_50_64_11]|nr:MAG: phosphoenolpyruvate--protein phosphotransferase [Xanthomonadales bacterium CG17_big_fil_post_rev_8_21_14_2_50_64_11]PIX60793.1 MAG: phosphoenolpyruvate--protein phosphotransferase [Xanthomonadales bacterium CG_4_10_14_3_um_filter_64_11]
MRAQIQATGASRGLALGRARLHLGRAFDIEERTIEAERVDDELQRLHAAVALARAQLGELRDRLQGALAHELGDFIDFHALLLDDPELVSGLAELIRVGQYAAEYALKLQRDRLAAVFASMDDPYFQSRREDLDHVLGRVMAALQRDAIPVRPGMAGDVLVCDAVAPSELAQLKADGVVAIVSASGSALSHAAILARSLHMPLVLGAHELIGHVNDGDALIVDGGSGEVIREPTGRDLRQYRARKRELQRAGEQRLRLRRMPTRTVDGIDIRLYANAESRDDVAEAHALGAAGVGLYRTEFLFLHGSELPDEEAQFRNYRDLVLGMTGRTVTIRTLDLGADKADRCGLVLASEPNPALGVRGVRLSLNRSDVFATQLRAILRASAYGPLRVLVPMIARREEMQTVRTLLLACHADLRTQGYDLPEPPALGAMIEVPAAALALHGLIDIVDFLSIGTNDLIQYVLAADRGNDALGDLYSPMHPAIVHLLHHIIATGKRHGIPVAVCGELAGDPLFTPLLLALGLTEFSLHPCTLLEVRERIRAAHLGNLRRRAKTLLRARDRPALERWLARCQ